MTNEQAIKKILVVEDDQIFADIYVLKLTEEGYEVAHAADGDDATKKIREMSPDILILDLVLPRKNGIEVLRQLRAESSKILRNLPVIIVTNVNRDPFVDVLKDLDVKEYYLKSDVTFSQVLEKIRGLIG